jgi:hypothetical protein
MAEKQEAPAQQEATGGFLAVKPNNREDRSLAPWIVAGGVVAVVIGVLIFMSMRSGKSSASNTPDAYASQLTLSGVEMSQSSNGVGSQITYIDGQVTNKGDRTVTGMTVRTTFSDSLNQPGQEETMALNLIRTRDPYIDIEPVSADPIKPGESKPFRLIFDHVSQDWNQQVPQLRVLQVQTR